MSQDMLQRERVLNNVARAILQIDADLVVRVGIDGVDGAGKTTFADELGWVLQSMGKGVIRACVDGFHNPRSVRYQRGRTSPQGFYLDSYNYGQLKKELLDPLSPGGSGNYRAAVFDHKNDSRVSMEQQQVTEEAVLILDGIFLHRPELRHYWDFSVFLDVAFDVSIPRLAQRDAGSADLQAPLNRRYIEGQEIYLLDCDPKSHATVVINNENFASPIIVT